MVERSNLIQVASDEWIVMREFAQYPKAVIRGMRDSDGQARFILSSWNPVRHKQRMIGLYPTKEEAEQAVPWPTRNPDLPARAEIAKVRQRGPNTVDGNGYPPGSPDWERVQKKRPTPQSGRGTTVAT